LIWGELDLRFSFREAGIYTAHYRIISTANTNGGEKGKVKRSATGSEIWMFEASKKRLKLWPA
jgi:hypothetical protein